MTNLVSARSRSGTNIQDVKQQNLSIILKYIALTHGLSRIKLARLTGLSKMAVGNLVSDLINRGLVEECGEYISTNYGRRPVILQLAATSPCICGMLISRSVFQVIFTDLGGTVLRRKEIPVQDTLGPGQLLAQLTSAYDALKVQEPRTVLGVGIAAIGPVDTIDGMLLNPISFYGISNMPIVQEIEAHTGLPTFLISDASSGALAERFYGSQRTTQNFMYVHIRNGIGAGYVLDGRLYDGDWGKTGEIGHTSINFMGPRCSCGNIGCLELYANVPQMRRRIAELLQLYRASGTEKSGGAEKLSWQDIVEAATRKEGPALTALDEFCGYLAQAVANSLNLLDLSCVVVGYNARSHTEVVERLLRSKIAACSHHENVTVLHSCFGGDAPVIGSIACVAQRVFDLSLPLLREEGSGAPEKAVASTADVEEDELM